MGILGVSSFLINENYIWNTKPRIESGFFEISAIRSSISLKGTLWVVNSSTAIFPLIPSANKASSFDDLDIDGQQRDANVDVGADEIVSTRNSYPAR